MKQIFEGEIRVWQDYDGGPTLMIDGYDLAECIGANVIMRRSDMWQEAGCAWIEGRWRITVEQLDQEVDGE